MVLFAGQDASGNPDLWVTDGTSELAVASSFANGVFFDVNAPDLTVFAAGAIRPRGHERRHRPVDHRRDGRRDQ
jgi:hypothetical protein